MAARPGAGKDRRLRARPVIGWREWLDLPDLAIHRIKVKVDTGARTSSLHAFDLERFEVEGGNWVRFRVHPLQRDSETTVEVESPLVGERRVRPSTGRAVLRPVIRTRAVLGQQCWPIEITLINRDVMGFRMLLGRQAVRRRFLVDPGRSFLAGDPVDHAELVLEGNQVSDGRKTGTPKSWSEGSAVPKPDVSRSGRSDRPQSPDARRR